MNIANWIASTAAYTTLIFNDLWFKEGRPILPEERIPEDSSIRPGMQKAKQIAGNILDTAFYIPPFTIPVAAIRMTIWAGNKLVSAAMSEQGKKAFRTSQKAIDTAFHIPPLTIPAATLKVTIWTVQQIASRLTEKEPHPDHVQGDLQPVDAPDVEPPIPPQPPQEEEEEFIFPYADVEDLNEPSSSDDESLSAAEIIQPIEEESDSTKFESDLSDENPEPIIPIPVPPPLPPLNSSVPRPNILPRGSRSMVEPKYKGVDHNALSESVIYRRALENNTSAQSPTPVSPIKPPAPTFNQPSASSFHPETRPLKQVVRPNISRITVGLNDLKDGRSQLKHVDPISKPKVVATDNYLKINSSDLQSQRSQLKPVVHVPKPTPKSPNDFFKGKLRQRFNNANSPFVDESDSSFNESFLSPSPSPIKSVPRIVGGDVGTSEMSDALRQTPCLDRFRQLAPQSDADSDSDEEWTDLENQ